MTNGIVTFYGQELITAKDDKDIEYVAMKPLCENLGLDWEAQRQRIMRDEVLKSLTFMIKVQLPNDTQRRDVLMLPVDYLNGWLFGIDISRLKNEVTKERVIVYKKECYKVLHNYWNNGDNSDIYRRLDRLENTFVELSITMKKIEENTRPKSEMIGNLGMAKTVFITSDKSIGDNLEKKEKFYQDILKVIENYPDGISQRNLLSQAGYSQSGKIRRWLQEKISILWEMAIIPGKGYKYTPFQ